jgi:sulfite exporter TauE/SafE
MFDLQTTIPLLATIFVASIAGSGHCVGMCGPLMLLATNRSAEPGSPPSVFYESCYHGGRLLGYTLLGLIAGSLGWLMESGGQLAGLQQAAAVVTGAGMILFGLFSLITIYRTGSIPHFGTARVGKVFSRFVKKVHQLPRGLRPLSIGLMTACLPCGWLYAFLLLAVGARTPLLGGLTMVAFWLGTIPALSLAGLASRCFPRQWNTLGNTLIAGLLIISGIFTVSVRAHADMGSLQKQLQAPTQTEQIEQLGKQPLPCCQKGDSD